ncbi:MAG: hypothetical protein NC217_00130 [Muribaculaceae bacterium]|nr:hypothetical protein [Muribaculaceae bacterium]
MNKTTSIIRIVILVALFSFSALFLLGEEPENCSILRIVIDKALAFAALRYMGKLYKRWSKVDPWLIAFEKSCDDENEAPNPCHIEK